MRIREVRPTSPGIILKELYLSELGITITEFAQKIGVSRKTVSEIINGKVAITPEMAIRLSKALPNSTAQSWLNLQNACDLFDAQVLLKDIKILPILNYASSNI